MCQGRGQKCSVDFRSSVFDLLLTATLRDANFQQRYHDGLKAAGLRE